MLLIKWSDNWADEMDLVGFKLFEPEEWEQYQESFKTWFSKKRQFIFGVGTNEEIEYGSLQEFLRRFTVVEITPDEVLTFQKLNIYCNEFGFFPYEPDEDDYVDDEDL